MAENSSTSFLISKFSSSSSLLVKHCRRLEEEKTVVEGEKKILATELQEAKKRELELLDKLDQAERKLELAETQADALHIMLGGGWKDDNDDGAAAAATHPLKAYALATWAENKQLRGKHDGGGQATDDDIAVSKLQQELHEAEKALAYIHTVLTDAEAGRIDDNGGMTSSIVSSRGAMAILQLFWEKQQLQRLVERSQTEGIVTGLRTTADLKKRIAQLEEWTFKRQAILQEKKILEDAIGDLCMALQKGSGPVIEQCWKIIEKSDKQLGSECSDSEDSDAEDETETEAQPDPMELLKTKNIELADEILDLKVQDGYWRRQCEEARSKAARCANGTRQAEQLTKTTMLLRSGRFFESARGYNASFLDYFDDGGIIDGRREELADLEDDGAEALFYIKKFGDETGRVVFGVSGDVSEELLDDIMVEFLLKDFFTYNCTEGDAIEGDERRYIERAWGSVKEQLEDPTSAENGVEFEFDDRILNMYDYCVTIEKKQCLKGLCAMMHLESHEVRKENNRMKGILKDVYVGRSDRRENNDAPFLLSDSRLDSTVLKRDNSVKDAYKQMLLYPMQRHLDWAIKKHLDETYIRDLSKTARSWVLDLVESEKIDIANGGNNEEVAGA